MGIYQWTTPGKYVYTVPKMVKELMVCVWGGGGGGGQFKNVKGGNGGGGAYVEGIIEVRGRMRGHPPPSPAFPARLG